MPAYINRTTFALFLFCAVTTAQAQGSYDASLNTLPEAQGWTFVGGSLNPAPSVSGGILTQNRTNTSENQQWRRTDIPIDFSVGAPKFSLEANMKVDHSEYNPNVFGGWRTGYSIFASDTAGHTFIVGISDTGLRLTSDQNNAENTLSSPFISFDTTSSFNTYLLEVVNGTANLYADGILQTSLPVGATYPGVSDRVLIGSGSITTAETEMHYLNYGVFPETATPEPGTFGLVLAGMLTSIPLIRRRRR